jgi:type IV pilus assembly protein PilC
MMLFLKILGYVFLGLLISFLALFLFRGFGVLLLVFLGGLEGWVLFVFFHYRHVRQNEIIYLLATAAESQQPLAPALWAYLVDRPRSLWREIVSAVSLLLVYGGWYRRHTFDYKVQRVAALLDSGLSLHQALAAVPGVASWETILAAAVGETTGKLAPCLRSVPKWRLATVWLDLVPRFFYPLLVLMTILALVSFHMVFIFPKFEKIFADFKMRLPGSTEFLLGFSRFAIKFSLVPLGLLLAIGVVALLFSSASARWYFPVVGWMYRMQVQGRTLKMLGLLLETGQSVSRALEVLAESGYFQGLILRRLQKVRDKVQGGANLEDELHREGFLPRSMLPLLRTAEKTRSLPWVFSELGELQARRTVESAQRFAMALFPLTILGTGLVVGFVVLSMFSPLLDLILNLEKQLHL